MPALLPEIRSEEEFRASPRDEATYRAAVEEIRRRHDLPEGVLAKYPGGSTIVFAVGEGHVVKLFEPIFAADAEIEQAVLEHVHGRLGIPTPAPVAAGELEGWRYVVMSRLSGDLLAYNWIAILPTERRRLCGAIGRAAARLHALPTAGLSLPPEDWDAFIHAQAEKCAEHQRANGLPEKWAKQIPRFLESVDLTAGGGGRRVLLHTELMREHVLVERDGPGWAVSGLFDFEPAMIGPPEYDFASAGIFLSAGEPGLFKAFLLAYGYAEADLTPALSRRIMAYALLHRYSKVQWYMERVRPRSAKTFDALANEWFGFA